MRKILPASKFGPSYPEYQEVAQVKKEILRAAGGEQKLRKEFGALLRRCIDAVIDTPSTGRCDYEELEKTEKTYLGTKVEIQLRALLGFPKGLLDFVIAGHDVDVKFTIGNNWMIPVEAVDQICIVTAADEERALCYLGLIKARPSYLTGGVNRDNKGSVSSEGFSNIDWLIKEEPYPANFWRTMPIEKRRAIFQKSSGNARVIALFEEILEQPIHRSVIEDVARQKDPMKRIRANGGAKDALIKKGIKVLGGKYDAMTIRKLGLPQCDKDSFLSTKR